MDTLVNDLTQKDENKALIAAKTLVNQKNVQAFEKLCGKSEHLFDFVKENVRKRIKKAVTEQNYRNIISFFSVYDENYADLFISILANYANEDLSDEMYELLENGNIAQKQYAAKYFEYIPDTVAQDLLEEYAFGADDILAVNSARALGGMKDKTAYNKAVQNLSSADDFEVMSAVKFLTAYGDNAAVDALLGVLETSSMSENIAGEIPYLMSVLDMLETKPQNEVLTCVDFVLVGLGEILPLASIFDYEIFETIEYLLNKAETEQDSQIASVLLRALEKFTTLTSNDEYIFDEQKDTKQEVKAIAELLNTKDKSFWTKQEKLIEKELSTSTRRITGALEIIKALEIKSATDAVVNFIASTTDETLIVNALGTVVALGSISMLNKQELLSKIKDSTLHTIALSYFN